MIESIILLFGDDKQPMGRLIAEKDLICIVFRHRVTQFLLIGRFHHNGNVVGGGGGVWEAGRS